MYKMKQMLVTSLEWRCCLGLTGHNCEQKVPAEMTTSSSVKHSNRSIEMAEEILNLEESSKILDKVQDQESWLHHLQNDISDATASIQDIQKILQNLEGKMTDKNGNITELSELQNVLKPHVENFLRQHFHTLWESFNKSLQDLSAMVHNLSQDMEVNRKNIDEKQRVSQREMEDYNQKFQSKIEENSEKLKKLEAMLSDQQEEMNAQQAANHINLTMIKSGIEMNTQLLNNVMGSVERQQAQLNELNQSLANGYDPKLCPSCSSEEVSSDKTISKHNFDELSRMVEVHSRNLTYLNGMCGLSSKQMVDMQQNLRAQEARYAKIVDGLRRKVNQKLNETRAGLTENLLGLNTSFSHQSSINEDLLQNLENKVKDLSHQFHRSVTVTDDLRNTSYLLDKMQLDLDATKRQELDLRNNMNDSVQDLYVALQQIRQQMQDFQLLQEEEIQAVVQDIAILKNHSTVFGREISHLKKMEAIMVKHVKYLNSSFNSLLEDTFRHMVILESLVGEDILEITADDAPEFLKLSINDMYEILNETEDRLSVHKMMLQTIDERLKLLEVRRSTGDVSEFIQPEKQENFVKERSSDIDGREHMEPNHEALEEKVHHLNKYELSISTIKKDFEMLSLKVNKLESQCSNDEACCNCSLEDGRELFTKSVENLKSDMSSLKGALSAFQNLSGFMETLSNGTFNNGRSGFSSKKWRKLQKQLQEQSQHRGKQLQVRGSPSIASDNRNHSSFAQESPAAFFVGLSNSSEINGILKFDQIFLNYGDGYLPKDGHFRAPQAGVYVFALTVEFAPGPGLVSLMVDGNHTVTVQNSRKKHHNVSSTGGYAILKLHKGQLVWLEVKEGAAILRNPPETTFGGFLLFKTF
uniref:C1q domain-containing protein n=2 Tax=Callorhinchus milii TaxID=7868 RepID=A0A4W3I1L4_CALMI